VTGRARAGRLTQAPAESQRPVLSLPPPCQWLSEPRSLRLRLSIMPVTVRVTVTAGPGGRLRLTVTGNLNLNRDHAASDSDDVRVSGLVWPHHDDSSP
jgi:hypothetical protein